MLGYGSLIASSNTAKAAITQKVGIEKMKKLTAELENKQDIVQTAILFVQQVFRNLDGPAKYAEAVKAATAALNDKGLSVTEDEIKRLIESGLKMLKMQFEDTWYDSIESE